MLSMDMGMGHHEDHPDSSHHEMVHYGLIPEEPKKKRKSPIKINIFIRFCPSPRSEILRVAAACFGGADGSARRGGPGPSAAPEMTYPNRERYGP